MWRRLIPDRNEALERLHAEHIARREENGEADGHHRHPAPILEDERVIELCRRAKNSDKFERLFDRGDASEYEHDDSRADQALVSVFAFYTQDPDQLDRLFRGSALYWPEKWGKRSDYRRRTIEKALGGLRETYAPPDSTTPHVSKNGRQNLSSPSPKKDRDAGTISPRR